MGTERSRLLSVAVLVCFAAGCEDKKQPEPSEHLPTSPSPSTLGIDAGGLLGEPIDPPAPAGDLKEELDRFVNVDQCVAERANLDPLVGDALGAIGYDTFLRDACRMLEATKDRKRETCSKIDSSALRGRCQTWVAMASQAPDACPMQFEGVLTRGRNASCVAIATRDPRLCTGESRSVQRGTCEAMVTRDPARCDVLIPSQRALCKREVTRWRSVLPTPLVFEPAKGQGLDKLPVVRGRVTVHGASGTAEPVTPEVDLASDFAQGAVVVSNRERLRVELGTVVESEGARIAASLQKRPRVGLSLVMEPSTKDAPRPVLQKLELELPGEAPIVSPPSSCDCKITTARVGSVRGSEVAIVLEGTLSSGTRTYKVTIDLSTFVRDVVVELPGSGSHVLPALHPVPGARVQFGRDGG